MSWTQHFNLSMACLLLVGCVQQNKNNMQQYDQQTLIFSPTKESAVVYVSSVRSDKFSYSLIGSPATLVPHYSGSRVHVRDLQGRLHYLGLLTTIPSLCFYAPPGRYELLFQHLHADPKTSTRSIAVEANQAYFYGVVVRGRSNQVPDARISQLTTSEGFFYSERGRPKQCLDISNTTTH